MYRRRPRRRPDGIRNLKFGCNGRLAQQLCLREGQRDRDGMRRFFLDGEDVASTPRRQFCMPGAFYARARTSAAAAAPLWRGPLPGAASR